MSTDATSTQQPTTSGPHPWWCARTADCADDRNAMHHSRPRRARPQNITRDQDGGQDFTAEVRVVLGTESGWEDTEQSALLTLRNDEFFGSVDIHIGSNKMRNLAAWLTETAEWVDAVHAGRDPQAVLQEQQNVRRA